MNFTLLEMSGVAPPSTRDRVCPCTRNTPHYSTVRGTANFLRPWGLCGLCGQLSARMSRTLRFLGAFEMCEITGGLFYCLKCPSKESL